MDATARAAFPPASSAATIFKSKIVDELGETSLLLPDYINRALAANERAKYGLTLFQTARAAADNPGAGVSELRLERQALGVADATFDEVVPKSRHAGGGRYDIPHAVRLRALIVDAIEEMITPFRIAVTAGAWTGGSPDDYLARVASLLAGSPSLADGLVPGADIDAMTRADRARGDSLHLVVMDVHKALTRLQARIAQESIEGARVYGIEDADRPLIKAFMSALNATAPLKFEHPGLGTTATRAGDRLVIQNDIGTTDSHVLVLQVSGLEAILTYTDVHVRRARFFQSLLEPWTVAWDDTRSRHAAGLDEDDTYYLCVGRFTASRQDELERYLAHVGSRIVFLIDWNRARKRLGAFIGKKKVVGVLKWAADHNYGHRAFLQLGGEQLVHEAIEHARAPIRYGERLDEVLGGEAVVDYLRFVLRASCEGLLHGRSERLIRDELKAELLSYFDSAEQGLLGLVSDHAATIAELASAVRDALFHLDAGGTDPFVTRAARRAARSERKADELLIRARSQVRRAVGADVYVRILEEADDAADGLEEAAFLLTLLPPRTRAAAHDDLQQLGRLLVEGSREYVKCVEAACHLHRRSAREDVQDFLEAVDRIVTTEHQVDEVERRTIQTLVAEGPVDFREAHVGWQLTQHLESASDALTRSALLLRDHVLDEVMVGR